MGKKTEADKEEAKEVASPIGVLEAPNELVTDTMMPAEPRYSARQESTSRI